MLMQQVIGPIVISLMVVDMSRGPVRAASELCADCSAPDPKWASVNRGVLICDECCSIHRSLGRHISQVKSLKKGSWAPSLLSCVHQLVSSGANSIWEYSLVDPTLNKQCRRKPSPRDQLHPTKADFIRAKYQFLAFTKKYKDEDIGTVTDLSKQLHSSVRTNNLETSLRLLSLGADPNYLHPERGNRALHVAAQSGQSLQVELLVVYGADPGAADSLGKTPADYAGSQHVDIAHRLVECQFELTDTLAYYLCSRKPDHRSGQHFIIPEMADSVDVTELAKAARQKLQALPHNLFEELAMDVFDEVDRRENDAIWMSTKNPNTNVSDRQTVPFLPVSSDFSSTRNQGRQKLARFNAREFATLIIDLLSDAKRRQQGALSPGLPEPAGKPIYELKDSLRHVKTSSFSDDEPAYDIVASDEDYSSLGDRASIKEAAAAAAEQPGQSGEHVGSAKSPVKNDSDQLADEVELRMALSASQTKISELTTINQQLQREVNNLQASMKRLMAENSLLKTSSKAGSDDRSSVSAQSLPTKSAIPCRTTSPLTNGLAARQHSSLRSSSSPRNRPHSMVETSKLRLATAPVEINTNSNLQTTQSGSLSRLASKPLNQQRMSVEGMERTASTDNDSLYDNEETERVPSDEGGKNFPSPESIKPYTENITKKIHELLICARENKHESYVTCSDKVMRAVDTMIDLFPVGMDDSSIQIALSKLKSGAMQLCQEAKSPYTDSAGQTDFKLKAQNIIHSAYDIAKAAKILVTSIEKTRPSS
ncbi:GIT2 [Bugula neritina]|uniref:GIT2 n=1 Tax=Bugula neritina TaxID=10212 RepID=A0A7J7IWD9_BUGNE|nr:GIT2 [Bugula neritina]